MKWRHIYVERVFKIPKTKLPSLVKQQMLSFWFLYHMCAKLFWVDIEIYLYTLSFHYWKLFSYWWYWITFLMTSFTIAAEISWNIIALRKLKYNELVHGAFGLLFFRTAETCQFGFVGWGCIFGKRQVYCPDLHQYRYQVSLSHTEYRPNWLSIMEFVMTEIK